MSKIEALNQIEGGTEFTPQTERFKPNFYVMTVGGGPGTGTTTAVNLMSSRLDIPSFKAGELFRRWEKRFGTHSNIEGFVARAPEVDVKIDTMTQEKEEKAIATQTPIIIESRLGAWIARKLKTKGPNILYIASDDVAAQRVWNREKARREEEIAKAMQAVGENRVAIVLPAFDKTVEQVKKELSERRREDLKAWKTAHPDLPGNPMNPGFRDINGNRVYQIIINTDKLSVKEVVLETYRLMLEGKFLSKIA